MPRALANSPARKPTPCPSQAAACPSPERARWPWLRDPTSLSDTATLQGWSNQRLHFTHPAPLGAPTPRSEIELAHALARSRPIAGKPAKLTGCPQEVAHGSRALLYTLHGLLRARHPHSSTRPWPHNLRGLHDTEIGTLDPRPHQPRAHSLHLCPARFSTRFLSQWDRPCPDDRRHGSALVHTAPSTPDPHAPPVASVSDRQKRLSEPRAPLIAHHHPNTLYAEVTCHPLGPRIHLYTPRIYLYTPPTLLNNGEFGEIPIQYYEKNPEI